MPSFYVAPANVDGRRLRLVGEEVHHVIRVARYCVGDSIQAIDGSGAWYCVVIEQIEKHEVIGRIMERRWNVGERKTELILAQALVKRGRFDFVVEKCTELGVAMILPMVTERVVVESESSNRLERWRRISKAAVKQSGRSVIPEIREPMTLSRILADLGGGCELIAVAYEGEKMTRLDEIVRGRHVRKACLIVGPEGGFTEDEVAMIIRAGGQPFSLGPSILRAETAGIVATALLFEVCFDNMLR